MHAPVYSISFLRDVAHKSRWDKPLRLTGTTKAKNVLELLLRPPARRPPEHRPGMPRRPAPECAPNNTLKRSPSQQYAQKTICLRTVLEQMCRMYGTHSPCDIARPLCPEVIRRPPEVDALSMPHDSIIARHWCMRKLLCPEVIRRSIQSCWFVSCQWFEATASKSYMWRLFRE